MKQILTTIGKWLAMISIIVGIVMSIRLFCVGSYRISTNAMEEALHQGDYVFVNKLPIKGNPGRNKVVLFTSPLQKDTLLQPLFLSRCIGMPGDTILVDNNGYKVNGVLIPHSPRALNTYLIPKKKGVEFLQILRKRNIPTRNWKNDPNGFSLSLTSFEEYQIREELTEEDNRLFIRKQFAPYQLIVPRKGYAYRLDLFSHSYRRGYSSPNFYGDSQHDRLDGNHDCGRGFALCSDADGEAVFVAEKI